MREGKMTEAGQAAQQMTENPIWMRALLQACLNKAPAAEVHRLAEVAQNELLPEQDSEMKYYQGTVLAACGEKQIAYLFLRKAVAENYCAYQALQSDPLLAGVRRMRSSGRLCKRRANASRNLRWRRGWGGKRCGRLLAWHERYFSDLTRGDTDWAARGRSHREYICSFLWGKSIRWSCFEC